MGVSGCGKTTVGHTLAERLSRPFFDADDFHPPANITKMGAGEPLTDADRWPWLERLNALLREEPHAVLACSALKQVYRDALRQGQTSSLVFVYLQADRDAIAQRTQQRDHFFPAALLDSQFAALEEPDADEAWIVDATQPADQLAAAIASRL